MIIGVVSDSHGNTRAIDQMLAFLAERGVEPDAWLHAGDVTPDADYLAMLTQKEVYKVAGNCDWPDSRVPYVRVVQLVGHRILLTHGHTYGAQYTLDLMVRAASSKDCDGIVFGHTHAVTYFPGAITILNPGSVARPRDDGQGSFALLTLEKNQAISAKIFRI